MLRVKRDVAAAKAFFPWAQKSQGRLPHKITLDGFASGGAGIPQRASRRQADHNSILKMLEQPD
jgi:transposase-like protein